jgi:hypothetical protein
MAGQFDAIQQDRMEESSRYLKLHTCYTFNFPMSRHCNISRWIYVHTYADFEASMTQKVAESPCLLYYHEASILLCIFTV